MPLPTTICTEADPRLRGVAEICLGLPETEVATHTGQHFAFQVRGKTFAYYLVDHHGDGRTAISSAARRAWPKPSSKATPARFYRAAYLARYGWVCLDLEAAPIDWEELRSFLAESYCIVAPKRLANAVSTR